MIPWCARVYINVGRTYEFLPLPDAQPGLQLRGGVCSQSGPAQAWAPAPVRPRRRFRCMSPRRRWGNELSGWLFRGLSQVYWTWGGRCREAHKCQVILGPGPAASLRGARPGRKFRGHLDAFIRLKIWDSLHQDIGVFVVTAKHSFCFWFRYLINFDFSFSCSHGISICARLRFM